MIIHFLLSTANIYFIIIIYLKEFSNFPCEFLDYWLFKSLFFCVHIFLKYQTFLLLQISNFFLLWWASILCMISIIFNLLRFALWPCTNSRLILENVTCLLEENTYFSVLGGGVCKCVLSLVGLEGFSSLHFPIHPHLAVLLLKVEGY